MARKKRILLVDDDQDVLELLDYNLTMQGYKVKCVDDPSLAIKKAGKFDPDLIVLDIMMRPTNGLELCRHIRKVDSLKNTPLFFLTAKNEASIVQIALDNGGDDLIFKTMGLRSLIMKINSVLVEGLVIKKRIADLAVGNLVLHREDCTVSTGKRSVQLSANEFELLFFLAQNPTKVITSQNIKNTIWGPDINQLAAPVGDFIGRISEKLKVNWIKEVKENHYRLNSRLV
jgi:two-component system, OmpR family, alkaline phosphatase synthesis response regulator PhoP